MISFHIGLVTKDSPRTTGGVVNFFFFFSFLHDPLPAHIVIIIIMAGLEVISILHDEEDARDEDRVPS